MRQALRWTVRLGLVSLLVAIGLSYLGMVHPLGDSLAVFRLWLGVLLAALAALALLGGDRPVGAAALLVAAVAVLPIATGGIGGGGGLERGYSLYQKNIRYDNEMTEELAEDLRVIAADFITLQEVNPANRAAIYDTLPARFSSHICPFAAVGAVAVASRYPEVPGTRFCEEGRGIVGMQVETPDGPVWVVSVHLHWPFPYRQPAQVEQIVPILERLEGPVVIGGDFNMVPWSNALGRIAEAAGAEVWGPVRATFRLRDALPIAIDHVLGPPGGTVFQRPTFGSDHAGLVARFDLGG